MAKSKGLSLTKDFGLGQHRLALPHNIPHVNTSFSSSQDTKKAPKGIGGKIKGLMGKNEPTHAKARPKVASNVGASTSNQKDGRKPEGQQPSPGLHSRVLGEMKQSGMKTSMESLLDEYDLKKDGTPKGSRKFLQKNSNLIRLTIVSPGQEEKQQVTLKKNSKGLGIHLSVGPPPVSITLVEPNSEAMAAGIKVGDVIQEVNGKDCQSMAALELSDLMELKSLIQHIPDTDSPKVQRTTKPVKTKDLAAIDDSDSDTSDSSDDGKSGKITKGIWNRIKAEGLIDSDSDDNFEMELAKIYNNESIVDTLDEKPKQTPPSKVEIDENEWKKMKRQQSLLYDTDAPSFVINETSEKRKGSNNGQLSPVIDSSRRSILRWPFKRPTSSSGNKKEVKSSLLHTQMARTSLPADSSIQRSSVIKTQKSVRSVKSNSIPSASDKPGLTTLNETSIFSEIPQTTPILGLSAGHDRRKLGRARSVRKPTKILTTTDENHHVTQDDGIVKDNSKVEVSNKIVPVNESTNEKIITKSSSSAGLVEQALKKRRQSITEMQEKEQKTMQNSKQNQRDQTNSVLEEKLPHSTENSVSLTAAQIVANAARNKVYKTPQYNKIESSKSHANPSSVEPPWVAIAKRKRDTLSYQEFSRSKSYNQKLNQSASRNHDDNIQTYAEFTRTRSFNNSSTTTKPRSANASLYGSRHKGRDSKLLQSKLAIFDTKID